MSNSETPADFSKVRKFEHPGRGKARARPVPKGRTVDPHATHEIQGLLGDRPRERHLLIEFLHLIQDQFGQISAAHLAALADEMSLAFAEVFETATFYAHFDVVKEEDEPIPALTVRVCDSLTCEMFGAEQLLESLRGGLGDGGSRRPCPLRGTVRPRAGRRGRAQLPEAGGCCEREDGCRAMAIRTHMSRTTSITTPIARQAATRPWSACVPAR